MSSRSLQNNANEYIEQQLGLLMGGLEEHYGGHAISFSGPIMSGVDDLLRNAVENRYRQDPEVEKLVVFLTTEGGIVEITQRIAETFRRFYTIVEFIVPNYAYSAGTILAMSGDAIHMDYYSRLGPIDPQIERDGHMVPALGYVKRYESLIEQARGDAGISQAEMQILVSCFDQAVLYRFEQSRNLSIALLKEWLPKYKFKDWTTTETNQLPVTPEMKVERAERIAEQLNDTDKWHSHGRGISMEVLRKDIDLKIDDFESENSHGERIREYYNLLTDYMLKLGHGMSIHTVDDYIAFG